MSACVRIDIMQTDKTYVQGSLAARSLMNQHFSGDALGLTEGVESCMQCPAFTDCTL
jgi:hypothetical protein